VRLSPSLLRAIVAGCDGNEDAALRLARRWQALLPEMHAAAERIRAEVRAAPCSCATFAEPTADGRCSRCWGRPR